MKLIVGDYPKNNKKFNSLYKRALLEYILKGVISSATIIKISDACSCNSCKHYKNSNVLGEDFMSCHLPGIKPFKSFLLITKSSAKGWRNTNIGYCDQHEEK